MFAVITSKGRNWVPTLGIRDQPGWDRHATFADQLVDRGVIVLGGPIDSGNDEDVALLAMEATDESELRAIFAQDPWVASGVLRIKVVHPWTP